MDMNLELMYELLKAIKDGIIEEYLARLDESKEQTALYHIELLLDAGYVKGLTIKETSLGFKLGATIPRLTQSGHELLNGLKNTGVIAKIKETAKKASMNITFNVINACIQQSVLNLIP